MRPVKVASKSLHHTSAITLFTCLPTPALLVKPHANFFCVLPRGFTRKRETTRSLQLCALALKLFKKAGYITDVHHSMTQSETNSLPNRSPQLSFFWKTTTKKIQEQA